MLNWKLCREPNSGSIIQFLLLFVIGVWLNQPVIAQESEAVRQFQYAQKLMKDGFLDLASSQFDEFLKYYPDSPRVTEALFYWAQCLQKREKWEEASEKYRELLVKYPDSPRCDVALYTITENYFNLQEPEKAIRSFERFPLFYPKSPLATQALFKAGELNLERSDFAKAEEDWRRILDEFPTSTWIETTRYHLAELYFKQRKFDQAETQINRLLEFTSERVPYVRLALLKAKILTHKYRLDEAEALYSKLQNTSLSNGWYKRVQLDYAEFLQKLGQLDKVEEILRPLVESESTTTLRDSLLLQWISYHSQAGNDSSVIAVVNQLMHATNNKSVLMASMEYGINAAKSSDSKLVLVDYLERMIELEKDIKFKKPLLKNTYLDLLKTFNQIGRPASALEIGQVALNRFGSDLYFLDQVKYNMGRIYLETLNQPRKGLFYFEQISEPSHKSELADDAYYQMALCYERLTDSNQEIRILENFSQNFPGSPILPLIYDRLNWYRYYRPADLSIELSRTLSMFTNLLLTGQREESIFAIVKQMFEQLRAYQDVIETNKIIRSENLLKNYTDQLDQMVADSYYRLALQEEDIDKKESLLDNARIYYLKYLASPPTLKEQLRVALDIQKIERLRSDRDSSNVKSEYNYYKVVIDRFKNLEEVKQVKLELADLLFQIGKDVDSDSIKSAIRLYDEILDDSSNTIASNGAGWSHLDPEYLPATIEETALYRNGLAHLVINDTSSTISILSSYVTQYPKGTYVLSAIEELSKISIHQEDWEAAEKYLSNLAKTYYYASTVQSAKLQLAEIMITQNRFEDALTILADLHENFDINHEKKLFLHGFALKGVSDYFKSRQVFQEYLQHYPNGIFVPDVYLHLADIGKRTNQPQEFLLNYDRFLIRFPTDPRGRDILLELADDRFKNGEYSTSLDQYKELLATSVDPEELKVLERKKIICMIRLGNVSAAQVAEAQFDKDYKNVDEDLAEIEYELGNYYLDKKYFEGAERIFKRVKNKYKKTRFGSYGAYGLGKLKIITNLTDDGLEILTEIIEKYPESDVLPNLYLTLGDFYYKNKLFNNALSAFQHCLELNPESSVDLTVRRYLIKLYTEIGVNDAALLAIRAYLDKYPDADDSFNKKFQLGLNLMNLYEYDRAIDQFRSLLPLANNDQEAEIRFYIAKCYSSKGQFRKSISEFFKVPYYTRPTELPWHVTAEYEAAIAYMKLQEWDPAKSILEKIVYREGLESVFGRTAMNKIQEIDKLKTKK